MRTAFMASLTLPGLALAGNNDPSRADSAIFSSGALLNLTLGLVLVLAMAIGLTWLLRRYALPRGGMIQVLGGLPLGTRERLLLVEVDEVRLLLGITPQRIQALHVFATASTKPATTPTFAVLPVSPPLESLHDHPQS